MKLTIVIPGKRRKLGEILLEEKMITEELLGIVLSQQKAAKTRLGTLLMNMGILTPQQFMRALSKQLTVVHHSLARSS